MTKWNRSNKSGQASEVAAPAIITARRTCPISESEQGQTRRRPSGREENGAGAVGHGPVATFCARHREAGADAEKGALMAITASEAAMRALTTARQAMAAIPLAVESKGSGVSGRATIISAAKNSRRSRHGGSLLAGSRMTSAVVACSAIGLLGRATGLAARGRRTATGNWAPICSGRPPRTASKNLSPGGSASRTAVASIFIAAVAALLIKQRGL